MAPEILARKPYDHTADLYSLGVVYYQMLFGRYPFLAESQTEMLIKIKQGNVNYNVNNIKISPGCRDFIQRCLTFDPKERYNLINVSF